MNNTIRAGTTVIARKEENPTDSVLVQANGRNIRPSCASSRKTGKKGDHDDEQRKEQCGSHLLGRINENSSPLALCNLASFGKMPIAVLDNNDGRIDQYANRKGETSQRHNVAADVQKVHGHECAKQSNWQRKNGNKC